MTRRPFGGGPADVATVVDGSGRLEVARNAWVTVYTASTGGTVADLLAVAGGAPVSAGRVGTDAFGMIGSFSGPDDGSSVLWGDAGSGDRVRMDTTDLPGRVTTLETETSGEALQSALTAEISRATTAEGLLVPQTRTVNGHPLTGNVTVTASDVGAAAAAPVQSVAGKTGAVSLVKADVGLGNVDNTADANKPVSTAQSTAITASQTAAQSYADTQVATRSPKLTPTAVKTSAYTAAAGDLVPVDTTSGAVTVTLPTAPADGTRVAVKHVIQGGANAVTVLCAGSDVYNKTGGATSASLPLLAQAIQLQYKAAGAIWYVVADDLPLSSLDARYNGTYMTLAAMAANPDLLTFGAITRDSNGAATAATVTWPDGNSGAYTGTASTTTLGAVDSYTITRVVGGVTTTYTQPAVTRDATTGAVTVRPALTVA